MHIREATQDDSAELQQLQARSPQGKSLIVSTVNTPDFFGRAKAYESHKVFVAREGDRIIGSAACAFRDAVLNGKLSRVGYVFQAFVSPDDRRKGVASQLLQQRLEYLSQQGAVLAYTLIMEGNVPSMRYIESRGFQKSRTLVMPALVVRKQMAVPSLGEIRTAASEDLAPVATLLNETWAGHELYEPTSATGLVRFFQRTPAYSSENLLVLQHQGEIVACLGFWDWSRVMRITVQALSLKMRLTGLFLTATRILPEFLKPGDVLLQIMLTPIGFKDLEHLAVLLRYLNNQALLQGVQQLFCICERDHKLLKSLKGFTRIDTDVHLYVKPLVQDVSLSGDPVFIDGIDM